MHEIYNIQKYISYNKIVSCIKYEWRIGVLGTTANNHDINKLTSL